MSANRKSRIRYKIGVILTMITPIILALVHITHAIIWLFTGHTNNIVSLIGGGSLIVSLYLLCMSFVFKLCCHHRMAIYYLLFVNLFYTLDEIFIFPFSDKQFILGVVFAFGVSVVLFCFLIWRHNKIYKSIYSKTN